MPGKTCGNGHKMRELQSRCGACGWTDPDLIEAVPAVDHQAIPKHCTVEGCEKDTVVVMVLAERNGKRYLCSAREVFDHQGRQRVIKAGWTFVGWYTRCAADYMREMDGMGRSRMGPPEKLIEEGKHRRPEEPERGPTMTAEEEENLLEAMRERSAIIEESRATS